MFFTLLGSQPLKHLSRPICCTGPLRAAYQSFVFPAVPIIYSRNMAVRITKQVSYNSSNNYADL